MDPRSRDDHGVTWWPWWVTPRSSCDSMVIMWPHGHHVTPWSSCDSMGSHDDHGVPWRFLQSWDEGRLSHIITPEVKFGSSSILQVKHHGTPDVTDVIARRRLMSHLSILHVFKGKYFVWYLVCFYLLSNISDGSAYYVLHPQKGITICEDVIYLV